MSFKINILTSRKKQLAKIIKEIANLIDMSVNDTVTLHFDLEFNKDKEKDC